MAKGTREVTDFDDIERYRKMVGLKKERSSTLLTLLKSNLHLGSSSSTGSGPKFGARSPFMEFLGPFLGPMDLQMAHEALNQRRNSSRY